MDQSPGWSADVTVRRRPTSLRRRAAPSWSSGTSFDLYSSRTTGSGIGDGLLRFLEEFDRVIRGNVDGRRRIAVKGRRVPLANGLPAPSLDLLFVAPELLLEEWED